MPSTATPATKRRATANRKTATPPPKGAPGLLTVDEAAAYLGTTDRHIRRLWHTRQLACIKIGKLIRFAPSDLDAYIESQRTEAVAR